MSKTFEIISDMYEIADDDEDFVEDDAEIIQIESIPSVVKGPYILPCGHMNWYSDADVALAKAKGDCCPGQAKHMMKHKRAS